jgi:guanosine-3',5'-bis(diphosphate) 3'-pyrophosphohydrolase
MPPTLSEQYRPLLDAVSFAARAHRHAIRKDGQTPYVSHVFRVCLILRQVFGVEDLSVLQAALLHDTIEDTATDFDDIEERFGETVARRVSALTKDTRLPDIDRESEYHRRLLESGWEVKLCKLADMFDNLLDSRSLTPDGRRRVLNRSRYYITAIEPGLPLEHRSALALVEQLISEIEQELATA